MKPSHDLPKDTQDCIALLSSMSELLTLNGNHFQSGIVRNLADRISSGESLAIIDTLDIWGGAGSVVDCCFLDGPNPSKEAISKEVRFSEIVIGLVDLLDRHGFASDRMRSRRKSYVFWRSKRV